MARIINLTQHNPTPEQVADGVENLTKESWDDVKSLSTFEEIPDQSEVIDRAKKIAEIAAAAGAERAMIGGAPFFMATLERALETARIAPVYSFTKREAVDVPQLDGSVKKTQVFRHCGFYETIEIG